MKVKLYEKEYEISDSLSAEEKEIEMTRLAKEAALALVSDIQKNVPTTEQLSKEAKDEQNKISKMTPEQREHYDQFKKRMTEPPVWNKYDPEVDGF